MSKNKNKDELFEQFNKTVNMTESEFEDWSKDSCSKKASLDREPIKRVKKLQKKDKKDWECKDDGFNECKQAKKVISFVNRMKEVDAGDPVKGCGVSKKTISLKNWGFDPNK